MWEAVAKVGTPLALAAFALAVVALALRAYFGKRKAEIETAEPGQRVAMVAALEDAFQVPVASLSDARRFELAKTILANRAARFRTLAIVSVCIAVLLALIVVISMFMGGGVSDKAGKEAPTLSLNASASATPLSAVEPSAPASVLAVPAETGRAPPLAPNKSKTPAANVDAGDTGARTTVLRDNDAIRQNIEVDGAVTSDDRGTTHVGEIRGKSASSIDQTIRAKSVEAHGNGTTNLGVIDTTDPK